MEWLSTAGTWVAVSFVLFVIIAFFKGKGIVLSTLDAYVDKVTRELEEARSLREQAAHLLAEQARAEKDATAQAKDVLDEANRHIEGAAREAQQAIEKRVERLEALGRERIRIAQEQAIEAVRTETATQTEQAIRAVLAHRRDQQKDDSAIEASIRDIRERMH